MKLDELERNAKLASFAGGSLASANLQACLRFVDVMNTPEELKRVNRLIEMWTDALRRHNAQDKTFCDYDLKTGDPVERKK